MKTNESDTVRRYFSSAITFTYNIHCYLYPPPLYTGLTHRKLVAPDATRGAELPLSYTDTDVKTRKERGMKINASRIIKSAEKCI